KRGITHIERRPIASTNPRGPDDARQKRPGKAPNQRTIRQRLNSNVPAADHTSEDDEHVVNQWPERRKKKETVRKQYRRNHPAHVEENLCGKQNARQVHAKLNLV